MWQPDVLDDISPGAIGGSTALVIPTFAIRELRLGKHAQLSADCPGAGLESGSGSAGDDVDDVLVVAYGQDFLPTLLCLRFAPPTSAVRLQQWAAALQPYLYSHSGPPTPHYTHSSVLARVLWSLHPLNPQNRGDKPSTSAATSSPNRRARKRESSTPSRTFGEARSISSSSLLAAVGAFPAGGGGGQPSALSPLPERSPCCDGDHQPPTSELISSRSGSGSCFPRRTPTPVGNITGDITGDITARTLLTPAAMVGFAAELGLRLSDAEALRLCDRCMGLLDPAASQDGSAVASVAFRVVMAAYAQLAEQRLPPLPLLGNSEAASACASCEPSFPLDEDGLVRFLRDVQGERGATASAAREILNQFAGLGIPAAAPSTPSTPATLGRFQFLEYLLSRANDIWKQRHGEVYQDMTRPLTEYFIASSHNTYLCKRQFFDAASIEAYISVLRSGCRCVELDCWPGDGKHPVVVTHGGFHTGKLPLAAVLHAIRAHAFDSSPYPVILSIENHCGHREQGLMADLFVDILGPALYTTPSAAARAQRCYPSPDELRGRILIKFKKGEDEDESGEGSEGSGEGMAVLGPTLHHSYLRRVEGCEALAAGSPLLFALLTAEHVVVMPAAVGRVGAEAEEEAVLRGAYADRSEDIVAEYANLDQPLRVFAVARLGDPEVPDEEEGLLLEDAGGRLHLRCPDSTQAALWASKIRRARQYELENRAALAELEAAIADATEPPRARRAAAKAVHPKLAALVFYFEACKFKGGLAAASEGLRFNQMVSLKEQRAVELSKGSNAAAFADFARRFCVRVYPSGLRINSENFSPQPLFNCGCQMVALNYQTADPHLWLNSAFFRQNGSCGYRLKPSCLRTEGFDPAAAGAAVLGLRVRVVGGRLLRHCLPRKMQDGAGLTLVAVALRGLPADEAGASADYKTEPVDLDEAVYVAFDDEAEPFEATLRQPELASLEFRLLWQPVRVGRMGSSSRGLGGASSVGGTAGASMGKGTGSGAAAVMAHAIVPVTSIRQGLRSVTLRNKSGHSIPVRGGGGVSACCMTPSHCTLQIGVRLVVSWCRWRWRRQRMGMAQRW